MANPEQEFKKRLIGLGHGIKPVVIIGNKGLTEAVHNEIELALTSHELMKIKLSGDRNERSEFCDAICKQHTAQLIHQIGHIILIYRENPKN